MQTDSRGRRGERYFRDSEKDRRALAREPSREEEELNAREGDIG